MFGPDKPRLSCSLLLESLSVELLAVGQRDAVETHDLLAVLGKRAVNSELVSWFNHLPVPANPGQHVRTIGFDAPRLDVSLVVFHVEVDEYMGIGPLEIGYGSFQGHHMVDVERRARMVSQHRP